MIKLKYLAVLIFACPVLIKGQDLTGTWIGYTEKLSVKLVIIHKGDSLRGYTYDQNPGYCQATFLGFYDSKKKNLAGCGTEMLVNSGNHVLSVYELKYSKKKGREVLRGTTDLKQGNPLAIFFGLPKIYLQKEKNEVDTIPFMRPFIDTAL